MFELPFAFLVTFAPPIGGAMKFCPKCHSKESEIIHDEPRPRGGRLRTYRCKSCKLEHYEVYDVVVDKAAPKSR